MNDYPGVLDRVKAVICDTVIMILFMIAASYAFSMFAHVSDNARIAAFVFIFVLYDPIFTSAFGGTLGHKAFGIRVKRAEDQAKNILLPLAIVRFLVKALLGWVSLLTVMGSEKRKAIHDYLVGSVVVYNHASEAKNDAVPSS